MLLIQDLLQHWRRLRLNSTESTLPIPDHIREMVCFSFSSEINSDLFGFLCSESVAPPERRAARLSGGKAWSEKVLETGQMLGQCYTEQDRIQEIDQAKAFLSDLWTLILYLIVYCENCTCFDKSATVPFYYLQLSLQSQALYERERYLNMPKDCGGADLARFIAFISLILSFVAPFQNK